MQRLNSSTWLMAVACLTGSVTGCASQRFQTTRDLPPPALGASQRPQRDPGERGAYTSRKIPFFGAKQPTGSDRPLLLTPAGANEAYADGGSIINGPISGDYPIDYSNEPIVLGGNGPVAGPFVNDGQSFVNYPGQHGVNAPFPIEQAAPEQRETSGGLFGRFASLGKPKCGPNGCGVGTGPNGHGRDIGYNNRCFPRELRMASHPQYVVEPPDVLYIEALQLLPDRPVAGERLVRQDGTISLGYYGQLHVAGLTLQEIEEKLRQRLANYVNDPQVTVDVASFNSKVYYVLGQVQQAGRLPVTGNETVLDALTLAGGPSIYAKMKDIHVARPNPGGGCDQVLWVDYRAIVECGDTRTNYQLLPGDRVVVPGTRGFRLGVITDNFLPPLERIVGLFSVFRFATGN